MIPDALKSATDEYRIVREYARGGMGITYLAVSRNSGEQCILKQLRLETVSGWKALELFEREAEILRQLNHPNIPSYIDYFVSEKNRHFNLVQTFIEGRTMQDWIDRRLPAEPDRFNQYLRQALEILEYLHALVPAVIHRDITPKNMILQDDRIFLVDFGSVKEAVNPHSARGSTVIGTFGYMPPEQYLGHTEPGSDMFSLGMSFVAFASHKDPFQMVNPELGRVEIRNELDGLPFHVRSLLKDMTEPSLPNRLKSASSAKQRLLHPEIHTGRPEGQILSHQEQAEIRKSKTALLILIALFLIGGLIALIYTAGPKGNISSVEVQKITSADLDIRESSAIQGFAPGHTQKHIAVALRDRLVIRDAVQGNPVHTVLFDTLKPVSRKTHLIAGCRMLFTADDQRLFVLSMLENKGYWWNTNNWQLSSAGPLPEGEVMDIKPSSDQSILAVIHNKNKSELTILRCTEHKNRILHTQKIGAIGFCAIDSVPEILIYSAKDDSAMTVYDLLKKETVKTFFARGTVHSVQTDNPGKFIFWRTGREWNIFGIQNSAPVLNGDVPEAQSGLIRGHEMQISPDGRYFAHYERSYFRSVLTVYATDPHQAVQTFYPDDTGMTLMFTLPGSLCFMSLQNRVALLNYDRISIWNIEKMKGP